MTSIANKIFAYEHNVQVITVLSGEVKIALVLHLDQTIQLLPGFFS